MPEVRDRAIHVVLASTSAQTLPFHAAVPATGLRRVAAAMTLALALAGSSGAGAQDGEPDLSLQPGEAYATRFSGTVEGEDGGEPRTVIDLDGVVGSVIDIRSPLGPPQGHHWRDEPQRLPVTAGEAGQVFGIAIDDDESPNIYLSATAAYGLHRTADNADWMPGLWGPNNDPGTVYRLSAESGYRAEIFATIALDERQNTGASLGQVVYDRWNDQLYVSDLETGMIHRISAEDGTDLGHFDHGRDGRAVFFDATLGEMGELEPIAFDPSSAARIDDCEGDFSVTPPCWNIADFRRRVWGLGVHRNETTGEVRLYYAVWGTAAFGNPDWADAGEDSYNSIWSVRIDQTGAFDTADVRKEIVLPPLAEDGPEAEHAVTDIAFSCTGVMLVAERGAFRNLGLDDIEAFATPHEARTLRYEQDEYGLWQLAGRYDVGFYDRVREGEPRMHANCAGGVDFGYAYDETWEADLSRPDGFVWITGDSLCSVDGPCFDPATGERTDDDEVHGLQGMPESAFRNPLDDGADAAEGAEDGDVPASLMQTYMIDLDLNLDEEGVPLEEERLRNDATRIGDVEVFSVCTTGEPAEPLPLHSTALSGYHETGESRGHDRRESRPFHARSLSHGKYGSHDSELSHYREASHALSQSHSRYGSHERLDSHYRLWSHHRAYSHRKYGSHNRARSWHRKSRSWHSRARSWHWRARSWHSRARSWHWKDRSWHSRARSWHWRDRSWHERRRSLHDVRRSWHWKNPSWHDRTRTPHVKPRSWHARDRSYHDRQRSWHNRSRSWHDRVRSWHDRQRSFHSRSRSWHNRDRSWHDRRESHRRIQSHNRKLSHARQGSHSNARSHARNRSHDRVRSQVRDRHTRRQTQAQRPRHTRQLSQEQRRPRHTRQRSQEQRPPRHSRQQTEARRRPTHSRQRTQEQRRPRHSRQETQTQRQPRHTRQRSQEQRRPRHSRQQTQAQRQQRQPRREQRQQRQQRQDQRQQRQRQEQRQQRQRPEQRQQRQQRQEQRQQRQQRQEQLRQQQRQQQGG